MSKRVQDARERKCERVEVAKREFGMGEREEV